MCTAAPSLGSRVIGAMERGVMLGMPYRRMYRLPRPCNEVTELCRQHLLLLGLGAWPWPMVTGALYLRRTRCTPCDHLGMGSCGVHFKVTRGHGTGRDTRHISTRHILAILCLKEKENSDEIK